MERQSKLSMVDHVMDGRGWVPDQRLSINMVFNDPIYLIISRFPHFEHGLHMCDIKQLQPFGSETKTMEKSQYADELKY